MTRSGVIGLLGATLGLEAHHWTAEIFGDNLLNETDPVTAPSPGLASEAFHPRPRTIGVQVSFKY